MTVWEIVLRVIVFGVAGAALLAAGAALGWWARGPWERARLPIPFQRTRPDPGLWHESEGESALDARALDREAGVLVGYQAKHGSPALPDAPKGGTGEAARRDPPGPPDPPRPPRHQVA